MAYQIAQAHARMQDEAKSSANTPSTPTNTSSSTPSSGSLVVHVCGKAHCEARLGIPEHLSRFAGAARVGTLVFLPSDGVQLEAGGWEKEGLAGLADYVCLTEGTLPRSFGVEHPI